MESGPPSEISKDMIIYVAVDLMKQAWDNFPDCLILMAQVSQSRITSNWRNQAPFLSDGADEELDKDVVA